MRQQTWVSWQYDGQVVPTYAARIWVGHICPDRLTIHDLGAADSWRGRVVRGLFQLLRWWQP
jgi:hypothetical protein